MNRGSGVWLSDSGWDPALVRWVLVSAVVHVAAALVVFLLPRSLFVPTPPAVIAYTVKIVDPSALGGRLPQGPLRPDEEPAAADDTIRAEKAEPEKAPEPPKPEKAAEEPKPEPPKPEEKAVTIPEKKPPEKKPEPAKTEAAKPKPKPPPKKPTQQELARLEKQKRDREIQDAIRRVGERGRAKQAAGLGGTERGKGAALGTGGDGGGGGILTGLDFIIYKNQVEGIIKKNWTWVGANPNLTVRIAFRILESGNIDDLRVVERSGDTSYDESVVRAIRVSSPLPPPPEKYREVFANYIIDFVSGELQSG